MSSRSTHGSPFRAQRLLELTETRASGAHNQTELVSQALTLKKVTLVSAIGTAHKQTLSANVKTNTTGTQDPGRDLSIVQAGLSPCGRPLKKKLLLLYRGGG